MKKLFLLLAIAGTVVMFSCTKTVHKVRVTNSYGVATEVTIGNNTYGSINNGSSSEYKEVPEGAEQSVTVKIASGSYTFTNKITVSGDGEHNWTLKLTAANLNIPPDMGFSLTEDK